MRGRGGSPAPFPGASMSRSSALVFNIQKFSVHDGPGIRTLVFFKGCPLKCRWCSNPESQSPLPEFAWNATRCLHCGECVKRCCTNAVSLDEQGCPVVNRELCRPMERCMCELCCPGGAVKIYGQEKNITTYNLARMNMLLHGVKDTEFDIHHGDSLLNDWDILNEMNPAKKIQFDAVVANPPFSYRWEPTEELGKDFRFKNYGLAPKSAADFAFLLHGFHFLREDGTMAIILPHGVLFRGGKEELIRKKLLNDGNIDAVIGLPANLFYSTGIPVCILVLKKCKKNDDVLFINASEYFEKGKRQNALRDADVTRIVETYQYRKNVERYSRCVSMCEIKDNDYNLNISRYISIAKEEAPIDLAKVHKQLIDIDTKIEDARNRHNAFLKELGLDLI